MRNRALHKQRGQALIFITVTAGVVLLAVLTTFNVGQLTFHRIKLQNTADAVAYSAAVSQARDLNFAAYMNRAVIANQVQVAQIVSLTGWARNFDETYNGDLSTISEILANLSSLSFMWNTPLKAVRKLSSVLKSALDTAAGPAVTIVDVLIAALGTAAELYHFAVAISIPAQVIPELMTANEPETSLSPVGVGALVVSAARNLDFARKFTPSSQDDGDDRMANVTEASTDYFYKNRSLPPVWPLPILIDPTRLVTYGLGPLLMIQFHSGGGTLKTKAGNTTDHLKGWSSLDATGLFVIMCLTIPVLGIPVPIPFPLPPLPVGRGAAIAGASAWESSDGLLPTNNQGHRNAENTDVDPAAAVPYGLAHFNPMTAIPAWWKVSEGPDTTLDSSAGLRPYYDIKDNASSNKKNSNAATTATSDNFRNTRAPAWVIEIQRSSGGLLTSSTGGTYTIGGGTDGQLDLPMKMNHGNIRALSRGEAYFSRPSDFFPRSDGRTEWGSLYSPYWQARLQPSGLLEQAASILSPL